MEPKHRLAEFVREHRAEDVPPEIAATVQDILLTVLGTTLASAEQDGCRELRELLLHQGGRPEATSLVYGDRMPATHAAMPNGTMARALDYCDAMVPGLHLGSSLVPAALAAAESRGSCTGEEFQTALVVGAEVGSRLNLTEEQYDGFDPTGIAGLMGATAAVARLLGLDRGQTVDALALAFNRCGGSFQSNVDGSLAARLIQGWAAQTALECALLAQRGLTGPHRFLSGVYGYTHLFGRGRVTADSLVSRIGTDYRLQATVFKKYPSCGVTQGPTELALRLLDSGDLRATDVERVHVTVPPYAHRLVGHPFEVGSSPRVNAQFNIGYCVAGALIRGGSRLEHFDPEAVTDPALAALARRVTVVADEELDKRGHTAVDMVVETRDGRRLASSLDVAPGFPGNPLTREDHKARFRDCLAYGPRPLGDIQGERVIDTVHALPGVADVVASIPRIPAS